MVQPRVCTSTEDLYDQPRACLADYSYHVPNGVYIPGDAKRSAIIISKLKKQGFKKGVSDIVISFPLHGYHGAYIELKKDKKAPVTDEQKRWLERMQDVGYYTVLAVGLDAAIKCVQDYVAGKPAKKLPWIKG